MIVVCDTSALINLAKINQLRLLEDMYGGVLIPQSVYDEVVTEGGGRVGAEEVKSALYIQTKELNNPGDADSYVDPLSRTDAQVIALSKQENADVIITRDRRLRSRARQEGVTAINLRIFFRFAKEVGLIPAIKPLYDQLRAKGVLIREGVYQEALREAGELVDDEEE